MDRNQGKVEFRLNADDLALIRFTYRPAHEALRLLRALVDERFLPLHRHVIERVRTTAPTEALSTLLPLISPQGYLPDFVSPPDAGTDPAAVPDAIRAVSPEAVRTDLGLLLADGHTNPTAVRRLARNPARTRDEVATAWQAFWDQAVSPHWPAIESVLRADVAFRAQQVAADGLATALNGLHHELVWDGERLTRFNSRYDAQVDCRGRGLMLCPSVFGWPRVQSVSDEPWPPTLFYPARNATAWPAPGDQSLERLLGATRAAMLRQLRLPASTTEVAEAAGVAVSTAHHHLSVLENAGLVARRRDRRTVWHVQTRLGAELVGWQAASVGLGG